MPPPLLPSRPEPVAPTTPAQSLDLRAKFDDLLRQRDYEQAWTVAGQMGAQSSSAYTQTRAALGKDLQNRVGSGDFREADRLLGVAGRLYKGDRDVARYTQIVSDGRAVLTAERQALMLLLKGEYRQSIEIATPLANQKKASRRLLFYMACSHAGLALESTGDVDQTKTARDLFSSVASETALVSAHAPYISPQIMEFLRGTSR